MRARGTIPRRAWLAGLAATLAAGVIAAGAVATPAAAANVVANPGFESGLSGWSCSLGTAVSSPVHSGAKALQGAASASDNAQCTQTVTVVPSSSYTLTAWVQGAYVYLGVTGGVSTWTPSAGSWTQLSTTFTTAAGQTSLQIYLHGWYAQGTYYADDVALNGAGTTPSSPAASPTRSASPSASPSRSASPSPSTSTSPPPAGGKHAWPYIDITFSSPSMVSVANATGQKYFTLAFILGSSAGCDPKWGAQIALNDSRIINDIHGIQAMGGDLKVSFGGAAAPYLEGSCSSVASLAAAYEKVIDTTGIKHLDIDIEASFNIDQMNKALKQVQSERPGTTVSFTLMVVGDTYGIIDSLGVDVLKNAKSNGVTVSTVNPMTMDYGASVGDWGDSVIMAAGKVVDQMKTVWPEKSDAQIKAMLGVTPMIGRNDTGPVFTQAHANKLLAWARTNHIDSIAFWSVGRDNGGCPGGGVSPTCSSISQSTYEFTNIFKGYTG
ncbi:carbohydrate binding domain-containing protein [Hamadaea tsunoensis]|uniref:carbohydrate binding domain-containing protein n=1 Tax=Hamadaea tsunoensis TaxID=53368 RepID=UPI000415C5AF|nr:carbohydrate binding domain-containing protein [Hamadaea tsunoensis]